MDNEKNKTQIIYSIIVLHEIKLNSSSWIEINISSILLISIFIFEIDQELLKNEIARIFVLGSYFKIKLKKFVSIIFTIFFNYI